MSMYELWAVGWVGCGCGVWVGLGMGLGLGGLGFGHAGMILMSHQ